MCAMNECPLDPGGYFIVNGTEKVILVQEQLSKNRIIVEADTKKELITASVTSSTHARKSKSYVVLKKDLLYMRHNILNEDVPICVLLKAMGVTSDMEMMAIVAGTDSALQEDFAINFEETIKLAIFTQQQALEFLGARIKITRKPTPFGQARRNQCPGSSGGCQWSLCCTCAYRESQLQTKGAVHRPHGSTSVDGQAKSCSSR